MEPTLTITITASDAAGAVTARRETTAAGITRTHIVDAAVEAAEHAADLVDAHIAATLTRRRRKAT